MKKKRTAPQLKPHHFKPGQSGNPHGRPPLNPIQKALKNLTIATYREVIEVVMTGNIDNLKAMIIDPNTPALQVGIARSFIKAIDAGDYGVIERIAERIVGKIPDELNLNSKNMNANLNVNANAPVDEEKLKAVLAKIEADI